MKGIKMSGRKAADYNGYPDGINKENISSTFHLSQVDKDTLKNATNKVTVTNMPKPVDSNGFNELDQRLIQLQKNLYTKVDEAKSEIRAHVTTHHRDDDIYKFLTHTKRGRILCYLFGYRTSNQRRLNFIAKKQKMKSKLKKLEV